MTTFFFNSAKFINFEVSSLGLEFQVSSFGLGLEASDEVLISVSVSKVMVSATSLTSDVNSNTYSNIVVIIYYKLVVHITVAIIQHKSTKNG